MFRKRLRDREHRDIRPRGCGLTDSAGPRILPRMQAATSRSSAPPIGVPDMIRIAYVIDFIDHPMGGTERQLDILIRNLDRYQFRT